MVVRVLRSDVALTALKDPQMVLHIFLLTVLIKIIKRNFTLIHSEHVKSATDYGVLRLNSLLVDLIARVHIFIEIFFSLDSARVSTLKVNIEFFATIDIDYHLVVCAHSLRCAKQTAEDNVSIG